MRRQKSVPRTRAELVSDGELLGCASLVHGAGRAHTPQDRNACAA